MPGVESRGRGVQGREPDTDKSRKPQAKAAVALYLFTHVLIALHLRFVVPVRKTLMSADVITNFQWRFSHSYNSYSYPATPL